MLIYISEEPYSELLARVNDQAKFNGQINQCLLHLHCESQFSVIFAWIFSNLTSNMKSNSLFVHENLLGH